MITKKQAMFLGSLEEKLKKAGKRVQVLQKMLTFPQIVAQIEPLTQQVIAEQSALTQAMADLEAVEAVEKEVNAETVEKEVKKKK